MGFTGALPAVFTSRVLMIISPSLQSADRGLISILPQDQACQLNSQTAVCDIFVGTVR